MDQLYWVNIGRHQKVYNQLFDMLPDTGQAPPELELFRCIATIYYDCHNNKGCNLKSFNSELNYLIKNQDGFISSLKEDSWTKFQTTIGYLSEKKKKVTCPSCVGDGIVGCTICSCSGSFSENHDCEFCSGSGKIPCDYCSDGKIVCPSCGGFNCKECCEGQIKCVKCAGSQHKICNFCGGSGRQSFESECPNCCGDGEFECPDCHGEGIVLQPQNTPSFDDSHWVGPLEDIMDAIVQHTQERLNIWETCP